ncbi:MAG: hypothetical protein QOJ00_2315 [Actinomycetota bacterium]|jgi:hypothetical protein
MADEVFARAIDAMTDVQRRSIEAAGALVDRLIATVDGTASSAPPDGDADAGGAAPDANDAIAGFARLWRDSISSLAGVVPGVAGAPSLDVSAGGPPPSLRVVLDATTRRGSTELWVHNPSAEAFDKLRVHCGAAHAADGTTLGAMAVTAEPHSFDLPARASRGVVLSVDAADARAGVYRAIVLVDGVADQWMPIEIVVPDTAA